MQKIQKNNFSKKNWAIGIPRKSVIIFLLPVLILLLLFQFLDSRERHIRIRQAKKDKDSYLRELFKKNQLPYPPKKIYIRAFKKEQILELWVWSDKCSNFSMVKKFDFCTTSGILGPKRKQGDFQIPEGFYHIDRFNHVSQFYLSLGLNYPNKSDKKLGDQIDPGDQIFIHGSCVTIGCIPITDDKIKELFWIAIQSKRKGQMQIPVHIFPAKFTDKNLTALQEMAKSETYWKKFKSMTGNSHPHSAADLILFWKNLQEVYDYFEKNKKLPRIRIDSQGKYNIRN